MITMMIKLLSLTLVLSLAASVSAYVPKINNKAIKPSLEAFQKAAVGTFAALTIASSVATLTPPEPAAAFSISTATTAVNAPSLWESMGSSQLLAEKVIREGIYGEYEIDVPVQQYDDARSTFKSAKETKSKKGKYTALLAILIVGSFVVPMAQYWWYVKDDDSTERFFGQQKAMAPPEPPKKKGWF